jgi:hypothetical protein
VHSSWISLETVTGPAYHDWFWPLYVSATPLGGYDLPALEREN